MSNFNEEVCEYNSTPVNENFCTPGYKDWGYTTAGCKYPEVREMQYWQMCNGLERREWSKGGVADLGKCTYMENSSYADVVHNTPVKDVQQGDYIWNKWDIYAALKQGKDTVYSTRW